MIGWCPEEFHLLKSTGRLLLCTGVKGCGVNEQLVQLLINSALFLLIKVISVLEPIRAFVLSKTD